MRFPREQELAPGAFSSANGVYGLPSVAEGDDEAGPGVPLLETPLLVGGESYEFAAIANLDLFFSRVYRYWHERGLSSILLAGALNLLALAFTAAFSTFLLLFVDWRALHTECLAPRTGSGGAAAGPFPPPSSDDPSGSSSSNGGGGCDLAAVALDRRPLLGRGFGADFLALSYITVCVAYLGWTAAHFLMDARDMREVAHFMANKLGINESKVAAMTWSEVVHRLVLVQRTTRLCIARDLDELDIVARIMRKENFLIALINRNVLHLHLQLPPDAPGQLRRLLGGALRPLLSIARGRHGSGGGGHGGGAGTGGSSNSMGIEGGGGGGSRGCGGRGRSGPPMLTKTLEWNLRWCILDHMFDERFRIRPEFSDVAALRRRLRLVAVANLVLSPFLLLFLLAYFFMRNAERLYHHPAALGSRRWSGLAKWRIRELNELPHYLHHRLSASHPAALRYVGQFPSHTLAAIARFLVFVTGSFVALLLFVTFLDESVLERPLLGRQVVWWLGTLTVVLATCRTLVSEEPVAYDPERALADVVSYTHYLPRHWRGRAHTAEVQAAFLSLFRLKVALFLEELASLVTTPLVLACSLPACADSIVDFVSTFTAHVDGVGDVCSLSMYDFVRHGNTKYGAPVHADKALRSRQGKLEKSFLTFVATYPTWEPGEVGRKMLATLAASGGGGGGSGGTAADGTDAATAAGGDGAPAPAPRPAADAQPYHQDSPTLFPYQAAAGASKVAAAGAVGAASAAASAAAAAALSRAASGGLQRPGLKETTEGIPTEGKAMRGRTAAAARHPPPPPGDIAAAALPPPAPSRLRPPHVPLHMMPYHGVRSYTSAASASDMSAAGGGGGWAWRPPGNMSGGGGGAGAAVGPSGGSPAPSVASSQFSNLAAPYLQYYPVPLFYAHQQQARHAVQQQQQHRRMYEQLLYCGGGGPLGPMPMPPPPLSPYDRRMAASSAAASWHHQSGPQPFDSHGMPYSGMFHPYPFHGVAAAPFPPGPADQHQQQRQPPPLQTVAAPTDAPGAAAAAVDSGAGGVVPSTGQAQRPQSRSDPSGSPSRSPAVPESLPSGAAVGVHPLAAVRERRESGSGMTPAVHEAAVAAGPGANSGSDAAACASTFSACGSGGSGAAGSGCASGAAGSGCASGAAGSGTAAGCGSDILDMRGVEDMVAPPRPPPPPQQQQPPAAAAALTSDPRSDSGGDNGGGGDAHDRDVDLDDEDPLGLDGFVRRPTEAAAAAALPFDVEGFGLLSGPVMAPTVAVPAAAAPPQTAVVWRSESASSGIVLKRWSPSATTSASGSGLLPTSPAMTAGAAAPALAAPSVSPPALAQAWAGSAFGAAGADGVGGLMWASAMSVAESEGGGGRSAWGRCPPSSTLDGRQHRGLTTTTQQNDEQQQPQQQREQQCVAGAAAAQQTAPHASQTPAQSQLSSQQEQQPAGWRQQQEDQRSPRLQQQQQQQSQIQQQQQQQSQIQQQQQLHPGHGFQDVGLSHQDEPTASQLYYSPDYYAAASPYYGIEEYDTAMHEYDAAMYGYGEAVAAAFAPPPPPHLFATQAVHPHLHSSQQHLVQEQQQQLRSYRSPQDARERGEAGVRGAGGAPGPGSLRASVFGDADATSDKQPWSTVITATDGAGGLGAASAGASAVTAAGAPGVSVTVPMNETSELRSRVARGHSLLQSLYTSNDHTVRHRLQQQRLHEQRSMHHASRGGGGSTTGSGGSAAPVVVEGRDSGGVHGAAGGRARAAWEEGSRGLGWAPPEAYP